MHKSPDYPDTPLLDNGLRRFSRLWERHAGRVLSSRLEGALAKVIRCQIVGGPTRDIVLSRTSVEVLKAPSEVAPHAWISMPAADWKRVIAGNSHVMAIVLAGRAPFPKDQRRLLMQFSMLFQTTMLAEAVPE